MRREGHSALKVEDGKPFDPHPPETQVITVNFKPGIRQDGELDRVVIHQLDQEIHRSPSYFSGETAD